MSEWFSTFRLRLRALFQRQQMDDDLEAELEFHRAMREESLVDEGLPAKEAQRSARRRFGNATRIRERCREAWTFRWLEELMQDTRYGLRVLAGSKGFTAVAVLSLALGIGANTAVFTVMDAVMFTNLPVRNPDELVRVCWSAARARNISQTNAYNDTDEETGVSFHTAFPSRIFERFRAGSSRLADVFAFTGLSRSVVAYDGASRVAPGLMVSGNYYQALGVPPLAGRLIDDTDDQPGAAPVAVISAQLWEQAFGGVETAIGATLTLNGFPLTVIGVTPPEFYGVSAGGYIPSPDVTVPLSVQPHLTPHWGSLLDSEIWWLNLMGRREAGSSQDAVYAELRSIFGQEVAALSETTDLKMEQPDIYLQSGAQGVNSLRWQHSRQLWLLLAVAGLVLLIACANLANLLLARAARRQKEITVRLSMGAGRFRIARQMLTEGLMLSCAGGVAGLLLSYWGSRGLLAMLADPSQTVRLTLNTDLRILGFAVALSILTGIVFGIVPAFRASQTELVPALKEGAGTTGAPQHGNEAPLLGRSLVVLQVGLSLVLLTGAALFLRSLTNLRDVELGFRSEGLLLFRLDPTLSGYRGQRLLNLYADLRDRLAQLPGVVSVTASSHRLMTGWVSNGPMYVPDAPHLEKGRTPVHINSVGPEYFETMGISVLMGRGIQPTDISGVQRVAVINQSAARAAFPEGTPIGRRVSIRSDEEGPDVEIVGLVLDARYDRVRREAPPTVYLAYAQRPESLYGLDFAVRTSGRPEALVSHVHDAVRQLDSNLPLMNVATQERQIDDSLRSERLFAKLSTVFGAVALALACIGLYGVVAYSASRRTGEIGVRMALGARQASIVWLVLRQTLVVALVGVAVGVVGSLAATRSIQGMLYGVEPGDPVAIAGAIVVLLGVAVLAALHPSVRASRINPTEALRCE